MINPLHSWDLTDAEKRALQVRLAAEVVQEDRFGPLRLVAGVDVGFPRRDGVEMARAAAVLLTFPELALVAETVIEEPVRFPYVPGLLSFREAPAILSALDRLQQAPDLVMVDGQGRAHPRRFGIACHLGLLLDRPALGCAKSLLVGRYTEPGPSVGDWSPLIDRGETVGAALRTRAGVKPVFVSIGHRMSLETAVQLTLTCARGLRLPEPTRLADRLASQRGGASPGAPGPTQPSLLL